MEVYLYVEINVIATTILLLIFLNIRHRNEKYLIDQKLYLALLSFNVLILITDTFTWVLDGQNTRFFRILLLFVTTLYYILNPVICMMWSLYIDFQICRDENRLKKLFPPMLIPILFNTVISILSVFYPIMFYIDANNVYHRGKYYLILVAISFCYLIYTFAFILSNKKKIHKPYFLPLLMFAVPPFIGGILQIAFYGLSLICVGMTISMLIVFINIQNEQMYLDFLTGLYNRRKLDFYLQELIHKNKEKMILAGIMLDINSFKNINDHYGHFSGDEALKCTSRILKKTFESNSFISRFGGDEFVILLEINNKSELVTAINQLKDNLEKVNREMTAPYSITLSIGADYYDYKSKMTGREFLKHIDTLMYKNKHLLIE